jgi:oligogalacturonide transport system substrate-binding protein
MKRILITTAALSALATGLQAAELRMSWWGGDSRHVATQEALEACGAKHGHTIKPEFTGWQGHQEKVTTQIAGGTEADIMQVNWPWLPLFSADGEGFVDLREYSEIIDLSQYDEETLKGGEMNGKLNGVPLSTTGRVFMFNKSVFDEAGLPVPSTWEELIAAAPVFKEKLGENHYPFEASTLNALLIVSLATTQMTGKDLIDPETMQVAWTEEELAAGIQFYLDLVEQGVIRSWKQAAGAGNIEIYESRAWAEGDVAGTYEWDSTYDKNADPLGEAGDLVATQPLMLESAQTQGMYKKPSMVFSISKNSENPEAAAQIINCLLNEPEGIEALGDTRGIPASKVALKTLNDLGVINPNLAAAHEIVTSGEGPAVSPLNEHPEVRSIFEDNLEGVAYEMMSPEEGAAEIIYGINDVLSDYQS